MTPRRPPGITVASFWLFVIMSVALTLSWAKIVPWPWSIPFVLFGLGVTAYSLLMAISMTSYWWTRR
jgi:hypothetical protein